MTRRKISSSQIAGLKKDGATVVAKPKQEPKPPSKRVEKPIESSELPASMRGTMDFLEKHAEATRQVLALNAEIIGEFKADLAKIAESRKEAPAEYTFDVVRGEDNLLKRVYARPGILK